MLQDYVTSPLQQYDARLQSRLNRLNRRLDRARNPLAYAMERRGRPVDTGVRRRRDRAYRLRPEERSKLLHEIGGKTLGAFTGFANLLDLPVSSVRDVLAGENPFDQYLTPLRGDNRVQPRELLRKYNLIGDEDTWGNFAGSIAADIALDPLTWMTFGAVPLTKMGRFAKHAGLLDNLGAAASKKGIGKHVAWRELGLDDLIKASDPGAPLRETVKQARDAAKRFGYKNLREARNELSGVGLKGVARFGLPQWKMFGYDATQQLKDSPGKILGLPSSPWVRNVAEARDALNRKIGESLPVRKASQLLRPSRMTLGSPLGQEKAAVRWSQAERRAARARSFVSSTLRRLREVDPSSMAKFKSQDPKKILKINTEWQRLLEGFDKASPRKQKLVEDIWARIHESFENLRSTGARIEEFDDYYMNEYFPRSLTELLQGTSDANNVADLLRKVDENLPTSAFTVHMLGREKLLIDIKGGTAAINEVVTDPEIAHLISKWRPLGPKVQKKKIAGHIRKKYGPKGKGYFQSNEYRGEEIGRANVQAMSPEQRARFLREHGKAFQDQNLEDWAKLSTDPALTPQERTFAAAEVRHVLRQYGLMPEARYKGGSVFGGDTRLWKINKDRYGDMAEFVMQLSPQARKHGLFSNNPFWQLEQYLMNLEDATLRANLSMDILSDPRAYVQGPGGVEPAGRTLREVLSDRHADLGLDPKRATEIIDARYPPSLRGHLPADMGSVRLDRNIENDLIQAAKYFKGPEGATYFGRIADSFLSQFKANVTSPFPGFHIRNLMSGQFRNAVMGAFSFKSYNQMRHILRGNTVEGMSQVPAVQKRYKELRRADPMMPALDDKLASRIMADMIYENDLVGRYGPRGVTEVRNRANPMNVAQTAKQAVATDPGRGTLQHTLDAIPGETPFSWKHARRQYLGQVHPDIGMATTETSIPFMTGSADWIFPTPPLMQIPMDVGAKAIGKAAKLMGSQSKRMQKWADTPLWRMPLSARNPGMLKAMGVLGSEEVIDVAADNVRYFGPVAGGMEVGHWVEGMNRGVPFLEMLKRGFDPVEAAKRVSDAQIRYQPKYFTPFESQWMKRVMPFYSFTSRSVPWAVRKFYEEPGNLLRQLIRVTHEGAKSQTRALEHEGPVPPYVRDTLSMPLSGGPDDGTKRFLTGLDVMSQDMWQLGMPLVGALGSLLKMDMREATRDVSDVGYELLGRVRPAFKVPLEQVTGTSLWQRGVEGGRPLKNMDPPIGRAIKNLGQTFGALTGSEEYSDPFPGWDHAGILERYWASSPASRYLSSLSTATDVRKGTLPLITPVKLINLGTGMKITDISPRKQETILREYLKNMMDDAGGIIFEKATFTERDLARMNPADRRRAMQMNALYNERTQIAKELLRAERARRRRNRSVKDQLRGTATELLFGRPN